MPILVHSILILTDWLTAWRRNKKHLQVGDCYNKGSSTFCNGELVLSIVPFSVSSPFSGKFSEHMRTLAFERASSLTKKYQRKLSGFPSSNSRSFLFFSGLLTIRPGKEVANREILFFHFVDTSIVINGIIDIREIGKGMADTEQHS